MTVNTQTTKPTPMAEPVRSVRHRVDDDKWTGRVLVAALVALALVTGLIYTFSVAVMPALADADDRTFVETMQRFNDNPVFVLTFGAALVLLALAPVLQRRHGPSVATRWTVAALVLYGIVLAITFGFHIPLNNDIDGANLDRVADVADVRDDVEGPWVAGNIVRVVFSTAAVAALGWASSCTGGALPTGRIERRHDASLCRRGGRCHRHPARSAVDRSRARGDRYFQVACKR